MSATLYNGKSKCSGLEAAELHRTKEFEEGSKQLKQMYADLPLENNAMTDLIGGTF